MIFKSKWSHAIYIIRPSQRTLNQLGIVSIQPGLRAVFSEDTHEFDSKVAQEDAGWSDEERQAVEKHLLKHKDYGNGLILMPGQDIPDEMKDVARVDRDKVATNCQHVDFIDGKVQQCKLEAVPGSDKCDTHREKKSQVVRGMLTTEGP